MAATDGATTSVRQDHGQDHQGTEQAAEQQHHDLPGRALPAAMGYDNYY